MINPIEHSKTKDGVTKYKVEPYVIPADVYGQGNLAGRGGWTWYTGSSSWLYTAGIKYILGLNVQNGYMFFRPAFDESWEEYSIKYIWSGTVYNICVKNIGKTGRGDICVSVNGNAVEDGKIRLERNAGIREVTVLIGANNN